MTFIYVQGHNRHTDMCLNDFLNNTNKYNNFITKRNAPRGAAAGLPWGLDSQNITALGNRKEQFDTGAGP